MKIIETSNNLLFNFSSQLTFRMISKTLSYEHNQQL